MNVHIVVEGEVGEKKVYRHWVPLVNPNLTYVEHVSMIEYDNFAITSGGGYPNYLRIIGDAIADVNCHGHIDRLVVGVDSEEMEYEEKLNEMSECISQLHCIAEIRLIVQHFCLETWALGNKRIVRHEPRDAKLREYKRYFNVSIFDPELLPAYAAEELNRAQFAEKYLRCALQDKYRRLTYTKSNPTVLLNDKYFERVAQRFYDTGHIRSFEAFLTAFV